ncbi:PDZK1-interacting protein 1 isoform X3 [Xyrichtys novacula]|uniref:PDZK1-interacting protein 1 isoform X3 n=1 Tax=Xyrichtys novacula TaxID=13765 RepID=A0AAV1FDZ4_XYRNO|nr:PDZK1-interacting protein 1 isoform X3 [Xyrichtys novacula]
MERLCVLTSCLLLTVGASTAGTDAVKPIQRPLPQWLTGLIAVAGFLFLTFVVVLVKKAWCDKPDRRESSAEGARGNDTVMTEENSYETTLDLSRRNASKDSERDQTYETTLDLVRNKDEVNAHYNQGFDISEEKVTSM